MREKISSAIKQKAVTEIETGKLPRGETAKRLGVDESTTRHWLYAQDMLFYGLAAVCYSETLPAGIGRIMSIWKSVSCVEMEKLPLYFSTM